MDALAGLDPEQRAAAEVVGGPVCILAGAGTGKTRAVTHRIAHAVATGAVAAEHVLAVTFTARAAGELRTRLRALEVRGVQARTFHAAALRQLSYFWPRIVGGAPPRLLDRKAPAIAAAASKAGQRPTTELVRDLAAEVEWAKVTLAGPDGYPAAVRAAHREPPLPADTVATVYAEYEEAKRREGLADFEDLLLLTAALIEGDRQVATELRGRYRWFTVDEYQDVNPLQQRLLDAWLGGRSDVCVVGDPQQTIYSFAGASPRYLLDFPARYRDAAVVRLVRNYRSTPEVVRTANVVAGEGALRLVAQHPSGPEPVVQQYADEPAEAAAVAERCRALVAAGTRASSVAVLYRVNAQSQAYEAALAAAGVPYVVAGGERFFARAEVREAVRLLRGAARSTDAAAPEDLVGQVHHVMAATGWTPVAPAGHGAVRDRWESVAALVRLAEDLVAAEPDAGLVELVADLDERAEAQHAPVVEGVTLASLHAAKGLEWDAVFLVGLTDGTVPIVHATTADEVAEERRLLYVGVTRARSGLHLSWASSRSAGRQGRRQPSRFLLGLLPEVAPRATRRGAGSASRPGTGVTGPVDPELFERLREWRLTQAREQRQPAFCVFTDATLEAIAATRPGTPGELAKVRGVGAAKLEKYAADVLAICAARD